VKKRRHHNRPGAATLEFAFVAPIVLLLFFGAFEYSRFNSLRHSAHLAAFEGARRGIVPGATASDVQAQATKILHAVKIHGATITVTPATITNGSETVTVQVSIPIGDNSWVPPKFFSNSQLQAECTLERETI
jgi:Flp pilus assembly protein TadG